MPNRSTMGCLATRGLAGTALALAFAASVHAQTIPPTCAGALGDFQQGAPAPGVPAATAPNVVVILMDDMGYSDIKRFGGEIDTPAIDALAQKGVAFTQFYNVARCSPSRASLLTGLYPHQAGLGYLQSDAPLTSQPAGTAAKGVCGRLTNRGVTMAEALRQAGYETAMSGKWHVGDPLGKSSAFARGFDHAFQFPGDTYFPNQTAAGSGEENNKKVYIDNVEYALNSAQVAGSQLRSWYASDLIASWGKDYIGQIIGKANPRPFFLYLTFTAPHFPVMAPQSEADVEFRRYRNDGWDTLRGARRLAQVQSGGVLFGKNVNELGPKKTPESLSWSTVTTKAVYADQFAHAMAVYAAAVKHTDSSIANLVNYLTNTNDPRAGANQKLIDNTLIIFLSDNGGNAEGGSDGKYVLNGDYPGGPASNIWVGLNWAQLQNTPWRGYKRNVYEGGISTPMIMSWPKHNPAPTSDHLRTSPAHLIDIMPTVLAAAGATYPGTYRGRAIIPAEGISLLSTFTGTITTRTKRNAMLFWEHEGSRAVRNGVWKAVTECPVNGSPVWKLYDMSKDRIEKTPVTNAAVLDPMTQAWDQWAAATYVDDWFKFGSCWNLPASTNYP